MTVIYFLAYYYPFWGLPVAYIAFELANSLRKRGHYGKAAVYASISFVAILLALAFFIFNGFDRIIPFLKHYDQKYLS